MTRRGTAQCPKGLAKCPGCGRVRKVYFAGGQWRAYAHHGSEWCFGPARAPPIPPDQVAKIVPD